VQDKIAFQTRCLTKQATVGEYRFAEVYYASLFSRDLHRDYPLRDDYFKMIIHFNFI